MGIKKEFILLRFKDRQLKQAFSVPIVTRISRRACRDIFIKLIL